MLPASSLRSLVRQCYSCVYILSRVRVTIDGFGIQIQSQGYVTTDGLLASLSWCQGPISRSRPNFYCCQTVACLLMWGDLSDERTDLSFTIVAGPRQGSHSRVLGPRNSLSQFIVPHSRLPKPGGPIPRIYILQEQCSPVIPPGTGFPFRLLLRLSGLRWRYSNSPPRGKGLDYSRETTYVALASAA
jgi:hypothetical protein